MILLKIIKYDIVKWSYYYDLAVFYNTKVNTTAVYVPFFEKNLR